ncbi:MAG: rod shape-determining protein MreC [Alphaproteobacteria bacterium]|nr:rod shape-determining protein MreC [Alphaproteobacteria bacterium]
MTKDKKSYKLVQIIKSALAAAAVPVFIIYVMIAKPDYTIMNGLGHIVLPVAHGIGSVITWPIHAIGQSATWVKETAQLRSENKRLRAKLDEALANKYACDIAIAENKKLEKEINIKRASPYKTVIADIQFDDSVFHHNNFLINRGKKDGLDKGMIVVSFDNRMVGTITDCGSQFCRVRALSDADTNIAVRISGSDVSGFLQGNGKSRASIGFFNDTQFVGRKGLKVMTSNISGVLPSGIYVGDMLDEKNVDILRPNNISRVMVLQYDDIGSYK